MTEVRKIDFMFVNAYLVKGEKTILFDTGAFVEPEQFPGVIEAHGIDPSEIDYIVISHAHFDHAQYAKAWQELSGAKIICHEKAADYLANGTREPLFHFGPRAQAYPPFIEFMTTYSPAHIPPVTPDIIVGDSDFDMRPYGIEGKLVYTPGHDDSCVALVLDDRRALIGDTAIDLHYVGGINELYDEGTMSENWICTDPGLEKDSIRKLLDLADEFYGGHGPVYSRADLESIVA